MKKLISACLELKTTCSIGCPYCLMENTNYVPSAETMYKIIDVLATYDVDRYTIGGGEPLGVDYIYNVGKKIKQHNKLSLLRTSASMPINIAEADYAFDLIDISIDSCKKETMKLCKPYLELDVVLSNIKELNISGIETRCNILLTKYNYGDLESTISFLTNLGIKRIRVSRLVKRGLARQCYDNMQITDEQYYNALNNSFSLGEALGISIEEIKTIASETLCIVKPNGDLFVANPGGLMNFGSVFNKPDFERVAERLYESQRVAYDDQ